MNFFKNVSRNSPATYLITRIRLRTRLESRKFHFSACPRQTHYDLLGVSRTASEEDIKKAFIKLAKENHPDLSKDPQAHKRFLSIQQAYEILKDKNKRAIYDSQFVTNPAQRYKEQQMGYTFASEEELNEFIKRYENMYTWKASSSEPFYGDSESAKKRYQEARQRMEQILRDQEDAEKRRQAFQPIFFWILTGFFAAIFVVNVYVQVKLAERKTTRYAPVDENGNPIYDLGTGASKAHKWDYLASQSEKRRQIYELLGSQADDSEHLSLPSTSNAVVAHPTAASPIIVHK
eukprot:TRINITY_DN2158_c0_g1_i1.p1 TRINITY_DN2158_c0_g1~~TRINITY_DN2158_c0_g1_i1.p1  ORF type:complete len:291 (+),score=60.43 TRINITY_DN2158_c0_g1_i1:134-1006(+)